MMQRQFQLQLINLVTKLKRIKKEIDNSIDYITEISESDNDIRCEKCGRKNTRIRMDKSYFCRSCGYDSRRKR